ncbi:PREDICTED: uncharacterized protein LOC104810821 [Tarenaya hassleriana]|uniref:uncharacterized protein LOC104810821 n=1 Tax=Tarenaya hassleriana TaxID=28532 RepID=UPI00053C3CE7|nr:PREDICTED: uncharacterized protein LOC104810821 [Tarenaya hassleriana]XP_010535556.1 PREDICTED: uncharacterized protein LOC104810821 [Tarenaya hassleriana]
MAIEKSKVKLSRFDPEFSHGSGETMSSDEGELLQRRISAATVDSEYEVDDEEDDDFDDADSGAGSDDFDLLELAETGAEFCQVGNVTCSIPFELYDLSGLEYILSVEVWNECLSEEERLCLSKHLPDMDHLTFMRTLKELFEGCNFHFGSPIKKLFDMLKGGQCEPRNALYLESRNLFMRTEHYHKLRKYHNDLVVNLCQIRDSWANCKGYSVDEKLRVLNIVKSQKNLMCEKMEDFEVDSSEKEERFNAAWGRKVKDRKSALNKLNRRSAYGVEPEFELASRWQSMALEQNRYGRLNSKGISKRASSKFTGANSGPHSTLSLLHRPRYGTGLGFGSEDRMPVDDGDDDADDNDDDDGDDPVFGMGSRHDHDITITGNSGFSRLGKKPNFSRDRESGSKHVTMGPSYASKQLQGKYADSSKPRAFVNQMKPLREHFLQPPLKGSLADLRADLYRYGKNHGDGFSVDPTFISDDWNGRSKKHKSNRESPEIRLSYRASLQQMNERFLNSDLGENPAQEKIRVNVIPNGRHSGSASYRDSRMFMGNDDTESDSFEEYDDGEERNPSMLNESAVPGGRMNSSRLHILKAGRDGKKGKLGKKDMDENEWARNGRGAYSKHITTPEEHIYTPGGKKHSFKVKQKGKICESGPLNNIASQDFGDDQVSGLGKLKEKDVKNSQQREELTARLQKPSAKLNLAERKRKGFDEDDDHDSEAVLFGPCSSVSKKRRTRERFMEAEGRDDNGDPQPVDGFTSSKRKGKMKMEANAGSPNRETSETPKAIEMEVETKPQKKPFVLITPTVHTGFSFSIIHLLTAVRMAMLSPRPEEDSLPRAEQETGDNGIPLSKDADSERKGDMMPSLTVQEIVSRVRSNPGDPSILETQEPLQDLVRGVLKIFSSKTSPLGAKGWKPLVAYEKPTKSWSWIGPFPRTASSSDQENAEEVTSPEAWGLPQKLVVKLVDSFANWLKNGQETLQQIGSLPEPPLSLMQCNLDEKERFKDLRAQKSLSTITPSSEEARAYFRREEFLRYSIPDRAFAYTAADGKKSIVAPLRRGGGKPTSKARDHFMLKRDRPPHVTILCLVRDAAARLPGSIGTRADVCTLIRDSQYIVEDVTDSQVNQVVSGALDRLHYERDPCVQFDSDRKLWVYLHRDREEEDFEDDGTSSTKKWKRPKKEQDQADQGAVTVAYNGNEDQSGFELGSDVNPEAIAVDEEDKGAEILCNEEAENNTQGDEATGWTTVDSNPVEDNTFLCQENSADDNFDD